MFPRPIRNARDLLGGILYFIVGVDGAGIMFLYETFVPYGRPFTMMISGKKAPFIHVRRFVGDNGPHEDTVSLRDAGILKSQTYRDNLHRTYRFTNRSFAFFKDIVERQDLERYKKIIELFP